MSQGSIPVSQVRREMMVGLMMMILILGMVLRSEGKKLFWEDALEIFGRMCAFLVKRRSGEGGEGVLWLLGPKPRCSPLRCSKAPSPRHCVLP